MKNVTQWCYHHHQALGLWAWLFIVTWALSGLAHPVVSRLQPSASAVTAPWQPQPALSIDRERLTELAGDFNALRAVGIASDSHPSAVLQLDGGRYLDAHTYLPLPAFERHYAIHLARHFSGDQQSAVAAVRRVAQFDADYPANNRLLPVWRVDFARDDGLRVYVDTQQSELASLVNHTKAFSVQLFRALHTWAWWPHDASRRWAMSLALLLTIAIASLGLWLYLRWWRLGVFRGAGRRPISRRLHAHLGALFAAALLSFGASGALHLWWSDAHPRQGEQWPNSLRPESVHLPAGWLEAQWVAAGDRGYWRLRTGASTAPAHHGHGAKPTPRAITYLADGHPNTDAATTLAQALAQHWLPDHSPDRTRVLDHFSSEYGFINKRLPVVEVTTVTPAGLPGATLYIQPHTRTLAAASSPLSRAEGYSFGYLHKWHHLDLLGRDLRDLLLATAALGIAVAAGLGLYRRLQR